MSKNDNPPFGSNPTLDEDRRQLIRVEDTAVVELSPASNVIPLTELSEAALDEHLRALEQETAQEDSRLFYLMRELHAIDQHSYNAFRAIRDQSPELAICLEAINQKLNFIGDAICDSLFDDSAELQTIDLSQAGIGFNYSEKLEEDSSHRLKLWFEQSRVGISATIKVLACNRAINGGYHISALFTSIAEPDRQIIAKHIMQIEASMRREAAALREALDDDSNH